MVNNYPEYAAGISYQKAEEGEKHFYNAQVKVDPSDDSMSAVLTKDGTVISELPDGGGGGGGDSDFSTAEVTVNSTDISIQGPFVATDCIQNDNYGLTSPLTLALYKGKALIYLGSSPVESISGDISADEGGYYFVTGGCTINFIVA